MQTYISILRGINVSGSKMIKMEALRKLFEELNFKQVETYIQSGNVLFQYKESNQELLEKKIAKKVMASFGFDVPVLVKNGAEWDEVFMNNPFVNKRNEDISKLHVTFLSAEPDEALKNKIAAGNYGEDEYIFSGRSIYLFCPDSYGNTKLNNNFFENKLKVPATTRNWKTVKELAARIKN